ncbi:hypothetical protein [Hahella sp. NBU794]|uniref:hypothetical protein n=1 Tax=Hahella sp. NBU794 TaxID=3422590 RepID=UPI003D6E88E9
MKSLKIDNSQPVFEVKKGHNVFNQLAVKVDMNGVTDEQYFEWLDFVAEDAAKHINGVRFLEKEGVRDNPPLNTAVYYDTKDYKLLPTGALLRTSCNKVTHAFCAFKMPENEHGNRLDRRHVFQDEKKKQIQEAPYSPESVKIVKDLLKDQELDQPGKYLFREFNIAGDELEPAVVLFGNRSTFFVRIDEYDVLRCSLDRSRVMDYRKDINGERKAFFQEVEISIYPRIKKEISEDVRIIELIDYLVDSLKQRFSTKVIYDIKYQRAAEALGIE